RIFMTILLKRELAIDNNIARFATQARCAIGAGKRQRALLRYRRDLHAWAKHIIACQGTCGFAWRIEGVDRTRRVWRTDGVAGPSLELAKVIGSGCAGWLPWRVLVEAESQHATPCHGSS